MAAITDLRPIAEYEHMTYNQLLSELNALNTAQSHMDAAEYQRRKLLVGLRMANQQDMAGIATFQANIDGRNNRIAQLEAQQ